MLINFLVIIVIEINKNFAVAMVFNVVVLFIMAIRTVVSIAIDNYVFNISSLNFVIDVILINFYVIASKIYSSIYPKKHALFFKFIPVLSIFDIHC